MLILTFGVGTGDAAMAGGETVDVDVVDIVGAVAGKVFEEEGVVIAGGGGGGGGGEPKFANG